ncbi:hypothetical protein [Natrinema thermotolerans]|uniref:hypothetical protein n=1 Tax=Natrinema thermotolerans TaxID=121872 RepID=UPI000678FA0B|nr:hypothetical protein [Natrinema thermotolerans]
MSSTQYTHEPVAQPTDTHDHDPSEVFEQEIEHDHTVCNRCFRAHFKLRLVGIPVRYAEGDYGFDPVEEADVGQETVMCQTQEQTDNIETCHPPRVEGPVYDSGSDDPTEKLDIPLEWKRACPPEKIYCRCGSIDKDGSRPPLAKKEAVEHAIRISNRLEEAEINHDRRLLKEQVCRWKGQPELASKDDTLFEHAVRMAVESARGQTPIGIRTTDDGEVVVND